MENIRSSQGGVQASRAISSLQARAIIDRLEEGGQAGARQVTTEDAAVLTEYYHRTLAVIDELRTRATPRLQVPPGGESARAPGDPSMVRNQVESGERALASLSEDEAASLLSYYESTLTRIQRIRSIVPRSAREALRHAAEEARQPGAAGSQVHSPGEGEAELRQIAAALRSGEMEARDLSPRQLSIIRNYITGILTQPGSSRQEAPPYEEDGTGRTTLGDGDQCALVRVFLDSLANGAGRGVVGSENRPALQSAFAFVRERSSRPGMGGSGFESREAEIAGEALEESSEDEALAAGLDRYRTWRGRNDQSRMGLLIRELDTPEYNIHKLYWRLTEGSQGGRITLPLQEDQRREAAALIRKKMNEEGFGLIQAGMAKSLLEQLDPSFDAGTWASTLAKAVTSHIDAEGKPRDDRFFDTTGMGELGEALSNASEPARTELLQALRQCYPHLHQNYRRRLVESSGGRDVHGRFIPPPDARGGTGSSAPGNVPAGDREIEEAFDRMSRLGASADDYHRELSRLRELGVPWERLAPYFMDAYRASGFRDAERFIEPLLEAPDPEGKVAETVVNMVSERDGSQFYGEQRTVGLEEAQKTLDMLSRHRESGVAREAARRIFTMIGDRVDVRDTGIEGRTIPPPSRRNLTELIGRFDAGPEALLAAYRLRVDETDPGQKRALNALIARNREAVLSQAKDMSGDERGLARLDGGLERLGFFYEKALRGGRHEDAREIRDFFSTIAAASAGLPAGRDYLPRSLGGSHLWTPYGRNGSYMRDFVISSGRLPEARRKALFEHLGDEPSSWKEAPLGFPAGSDELSRRGVELANRYYQEMRGLVIERERLDRLGQNTDALQRKIEEKTRAYERERAGLPGLTGRVEAAAALGDRFDSLTHYLDARGGPYPRVITPESRQRDAGQFDGLLMSASKVREIDNGETLGRLLGLAGAGRGIDPATLQFVFEASRDLPAENLKAVVRNAGTPEKLLEGIGDLCLRKLRDYSREGESSPLFQGSVLRASSGSPMGERMAQFLVAQGRSHELMLNPDGSRSVIDTLTERSGRDLDARSAARTILEQAAGTATLVPSNTSSGRLAQVNRIRLELAAGRSDSRDHLIQSLRELRRGSSSLPSGEREIQDFANLEGTIALADAITGKYYNFSWMQKPQVTSALAEIEGLLQQIRQDRGRIPESMEADPRYRRYTGELESARQRLEAKKLQARQRLGQITEEERDRRLQEQLQFRGGMDFRAIRGLIRLAVDSPTDSFFVGINARVGVAVDIPFFGRAEAFVDGKAGFYLSMTEEGQVVVSFSARIGVGAGVQSDTLRAGGSGGAGRYTMISYSFANEDEAAKFIQSIMHQIGISEENPRYDPPVAVNRTGSYTELEGHAGPVAVSRRAREETAEVRYQVPWLPQGQSQQTTISSMHETDSARIRIRGADVELSVTAEDQNGARNQVANGTTLTFGFGAGAGIGGGRSEHLLDTPMEFVNNLLESVKQMRPELLKRIPGADRMTPQQLDDAARQRLLQGFTHADFRASLSAQGRVEVTLASPVHLMLDKKMQAFEVLFNLVESIFTSDPGHNRWTFQNARSAREVSFEARVRLQYGSVVNVFAELGIEAHSRDATTLAGSLWHARQMLYESRSGAYFSESQLAELSRDGIIRSDGTLDRDAFNCVLAVMRKELLALYDDPEWRRGHISSSMTREQFTANIDSHLQGIMRSMWAGLRNSQRTFDSAEEFQKTVSIDHVKTFERYIRENSLDTLRAESALQSFRDSGGSRSRHVTYSQ
ncbi:MAG: hypothetical protein RDV48_24600 [Candidatus Eremiobacteraeota bacterium]|nr:hypothetical protein [Candidatus Eremiobacteraeota bacterium]